MGEKGGEQHDGQGRDESRKWRILSAGTYLQQARILCAPRQQPFPLHRREQHEAFLHLFRLAEKERTPLLVGDLGLLRLRPQQLLEALEQLDQLLLVRRAVHLQEQSAWEERCAPKGASAGGGSHSSHSSHSHSQQHNIWKASEQANAAPHT